MANFWESPLKPFEKNKITALDYVRAEHYQDLIRERFTYNTARVLLDNYMRMEVNVYVFSEKELTKLLTDLKR